MRRLGMALMTLGLLMGCRGAIAAQPSLAELQAWTGKYAFDKIGGVSLWDHPLFVAEATKVLGSETLGLITGTYATGPNTPLVRNGDILSFFACRAHECITDSARILIDVKESKLYVCLHDSYRKEDQWFESGKEMRGVGESGCAVTEPYELYNMYIKK